MILVAGATGNLGGEICRQLREHGKPVRAFVRTTSDPVKVENLKQSGAELVSGDLRDPASLDAACQGVDTVITTVTTVLSREPGNRIDTVDQVGQKNLVDAARKAGVARFIYTSYSSNIDVDCPLTTAKRSVEHHLKASGLNYTILQPSYFMEVWLGPFLGFDIANAKAQIYGSGESKISFISLGDVARFAVEAVDNPAAQNSTLPLGGPEPVSPLEVIRMGEELSGRKFEVQLVPIEALEAQRMSAEDLLGKSFASLMLAYAKGDPIEMAETLKAFPLRLTPVREYVKRCLTVQV
jgi:uncharacterized protein YbjT (DUF2867 family)